MKTSILFKSLVVSTLVFLVVDYTDAQESEDLGFTWWNDVPELVKRGNDAYKKSVESGEKESADGESTLSGIEESEKYYRDALFEDPSQAVAAFNLGLAKAKKGEHDSAVSFYEEAMSLAGADADLRSKAIYNTGVSRLEQALEAFDNDERESGIRQAIDALDAFEKTLDLDPSNDNARINREEIQKVLQKYTQTPPPQQQQQQQQQGDSESDQQQQQQQQDQQDQQQQQQQEQEQEQEEQEQEQQQDQQEQEQNESEQQQEQENQEQQEGQQPQDQQQEGNPQDQENQQQGQGSQAQEAEELTEEEARELLNMLGDLENIILQKRHNRISQPDPEKDW